MPSTPEEKKKVLTRVRRIRGQIDALERALENGTECRSSADSCRSRSS